MILRDLPGPLTFKHFRGRQLDWGKCPVFLVGVNWYIYQSPLAHKVITSLHRYLHVWKEVMSRLSTTHTFFCYISIYSDSGHVCLGCSGNTPSLPLCCEAGDQQTFFLIFAPRMKRCHCYGSEETILWLSNISTFWHSLQNLSR